MPTPAEYAERCREWGEALRPFLRNTEYLLNTWITEGKSVLFEGAQGTLLDVDHGTYPFVTSSNSTAGGACTGTGVPPTRIDGAIGVLKAYTTRVGGGPFPSELSGDTAEFLRKRGNEYGTVTGRPRRCGWLDMVVARYAQLLNGIDMIALTKLDVLDDFDEIPVCVGYRVNGKEVRDFPCDRQSLGAVEPVLKTMKGWKRSTVGILDEADLPQEAKDYIDFLEQEVGAPVDAGLHRPAARRDARPGQPRRRHASPPAASARSSNSADLRRTLRSRSEHFGSAPGPFGFNPLNPE